MRRYLLLINTLALSLASLFVQCNEYVVLESTHDTYVKGQLLSSKESLTLDKNQTMNVIGDDGNLVLIKGLFSGIIGDVSTKNEQSKDSVINKLSTFMTSLLMLLTSKQETQLVAARSLSIKGTGGFTDNLDPWMIEITHKGHKCVNKTLPLLKRINEGTSVITLTYMLNNTQQQIHTSPGSEKVQLASSYKTHEIVFHKTKQDFKNPTFSALWMAYKGCHQQANTMISTLRVNQVIEQQAPR
jgi:hypothetical protein